MTACPQCGTVAKPTDKFCNTCGTRLAVAEAAPPAPQYAPPPQAAPAMPQYGGQSQPQPGMQGGAMRCQMGHDIAPGASYCAQGHPIALAAMQFSQDQYAQPAPGFGQAPAPQPQPQPPFGGQAGFGGYGAAGPGGPGAGPQPSPSPIGAQPGFPDPNAGFGGGGFGQPQPPMNPQFGAQAGYGQAPQAPQYAPQPFSGQAPQQPVFNPAAQPPQQTPGGQPAPQSPSFGSPTASTTPDTGAKILRGFLVAYQANSNGDFWPLTGGRLTLGRAGSGENVDIALADPTISSKHAIFAVDGAAGTVSVEDTGSTNGTFVNEEHIGFNGRRDLRDGDRVRFGGFTTIVKVIGRT